MEIKFEFKVDWYVKLKKEKMCIFTKPKNTMSANTVQGILSEFYKHNILQGFVHLPEQSYQVHRD